MQLNPHRYFAQYWKPRHIIVAFCYVRLSDNFTGLYPFGWDWDIPYLFVSHELYPYLKNPVDQCLIEEELDFY